MYENSGMGVRIQSERVYENPRNPHVVTLATEMGCMSVSEADQLPDSLAYLAYRLPGLVFWHFPLGGGDPVPQLRPDDPIPDKPKYIFPKGSGSVISISPKMRIRLDEDTDRIKRVLVVENKLRQAVADIESGTGLD